MEQWDVFNIDRLPTGKTALRGEKMAEGDYHLVIHICIFNSDGKMLIQQRQPWKSFGNKWDVTVGGSALKGESSRDAAQRELFEELGIEHDFSSLRPNMTMNFEEGFDDFYLINRDIELTSLSLQPEEVKSARWASREEVLELIDKGEFIPFFKSFISLLFDVRQKPDCLNM